MVHGLMFSGEAAGWPATPAPRQPPDISVGPTVDDFANALADHPLLDVTTPVDVTLDGYSGKYVDLQVPSDISACSFPMAIAHGSRGSTPRDQATDGTSGSSMSMGSASW